MLSNHSEETINTYPINTTHVKHYLEDLIKLQHNQQLIIFSIKLQ